MTSVKYDIDAMVGPTHPGVRRIDPADLKVVLAKALDDFLAMPTFSFFLVAVYPLIGARSRISSARTFDAAPLSRSRRGLMVHWRDREMR